MGMNGPVVGFLLRLFFYHGTTVLMGQGLFIIEDSWSQSDTPQSVGLLWTSDQSDAEASTWQHTTIMRPTSMPPTGFEPTIPASEPPQTHALERSATGTGCVWSRSPINEGPYARVALLRHGREETEITGGSRQLRYCGTEGKRQK
jgi:hypothetical protein